jgi:hypothetical protein
LFLDSLDIWKEVKIEIGRFESETENAEKKQQILKYLKNLVNSPLNEAISFMKRQKEGVSEEWKSKIDADIQNILFIREDLQLDIEK